MKQNKLTSMSLGLAFAMAAAIPLASAAEGEFNGQCAMGHAIGKVVKTECKVTWESEDGKTYCFGNEDAKKKFLEDPSANLEKAKEHYKGAQG